MAKRLDRPVKTTVVNGQPVRSIISPQEVKKTIMRANKWTAEQYRKNVDIFKNKLRAYETYERAQGVNVTAQSPVTLLYKQARTKERVERRGETYKPSVRMTRINSFSAYSISKGRKEYSTDTKAKRKMDIKVLTDISTKMGNFIATHAEEVDKIRKIFGDSPAKYEKALSLYAEKVKAKRDDDMKTTGEEPIAYGERAGSPEVPFDMDDLREALEEME